MFVHPHRSPLPALLNQNVPMAESGAGGSILDDNKENQPVGIEWNASTNRKYGRLLALSNAHHGDLSRLLGDDNKAELQKRANQYKSAAMVGSWPNKVRPANEDQMTKRMEQLHNSKQYLKERLADQSAEPVLSVDPEMFGTLEDGIFSHPDAEVLPFLRNTGGPSFAESFAAFEAELNFAVEQSQHPIEHWSLASRDLTGPAKLSTFESFHNFCRRLPSNNYTEGMLRKFYYIIKRMSVETIETLPSNRSFDSSESKRTSFASISSVNTLRAFSSLPALRQDVAEYFDPLVSAYPGGSSKAMLQKLSLFPQPPFRASSKSPSQIMNTPQKSTVPIPSGEVMTTTKPTKVKSNSQPWCCLNVCRGDPRATKCDLCQIFEPLSHQVVRELVGKWKENPKQNLVKALVSAQPMIDPLETDLFHDTVLHLAASLGAGSGILRWLITIGVDVHARNAANQTFLHVLDPVCFAYFGTASSRPDQKDDIGDILKLLISAGFDFETPDDYGQNMIAVLTKRGISTTTLNCMLYYIPGSAIQKSSLLFQRAFNGHRVVGERSIRLCAYMVLGLPKETHDAYWKNKHYVSSLVDIQTLSGNSKLDQLHINLQKAIQRAIEGYPETEYLGFNALHCLAISCRPRKFRGAKNISSPEAKEQKKETSRTSKKRQADSEEPLRREVILGQVKKLLEAKVDTNGYDKLGNTPMMAFIVNPHGERQDRELLAGVLKLMIDSGADVHRRNRKNETALHIAMRLGRIGAVDALLKNGAHVHATARHGVGILAAATKAWHKAKKDGALHTSLGVCMSMAQEHGAVMEPSSDTEWKQRMGPILWNEDYVRVPKRLSAEKVELGSKISQGRQKGRRP